MRSVLLLGTARRGWVGRLELQSEKNEATKAAADWYVEVQRLRAENDDLRKRASELEWLYAQKSDRLTKLEAAARDVVAVHDEVPTFSDDATDLRAFRKSAEPVYRLVQALKGGENE